VISHETVRPDEDRIRAILHYPVPKNQRQLRRFLGVCNYHHQLIVGYAAYVELLLVLLRKGNKWNWIQELQQAFEILRSKFATNIHLVHSCQDKDWIINTDASGFAIGSVLIKEGDNGGYNIISTASRVLTPVEQRYTTCERELLAIIYALQKFRIYVYGRKITINSDNKALSFLDRCVVTSNRVARWMIQLQEFDLQIKHIKGVQNHMADILSRRPTGLSEQEARNINRPDKVMVNRINIYKDRGLEKELRAMGTLQGADNRLRELKQKVRTDPSRVTDYMKREDVIVRKERMNKVGKPCYHHV
jgi:hypothetical protein